MPFVPDTQPEEKGRFVVDDPSKTTAYIDKRNAEAGVKPFEPSLPERGLRYLGEWGEQMRDAAAMPGEPGILGAITGPLKGAADAGLTLGTGALSSAAALANLPRARLTGDETPYSEMVAENTWQPRTPVGQAIVQGAGAVLKPALDVFTGAGNVVGAGAEVLGASPGVARDVREVVPDALGTALDVGGLLAARRVAGASGTALRETVAKPKPNASAATYGRSTADARALGFALNPNSVALKQQRVSGLGSIPHTPGTFMARFTGSELDQRLAVRNQQLADVYAARELGLPEGRVKLSDEAPLKPAVLEQARQPAEAVYNEVRERLAATPIDVHGEGFDLIQAIGADRRMNPLLENNSHLDELVGRLMDTPAVSIDDAMEAVRQLRRDARVLFKSADDPKKLDAAAGYRKAADLIENAIERAADSTKDFSLATRWRAAREQLAKINNVEDVLIDGSIDLHALAQLKKSGAPLTGLLDQMADIAVHFPKETRPAVPLRSQAGSLSGMIMQPGYAARRLGLGEKTFLPKLLSEEFQSGYGPSLAATLGGDPAASLAPPSRPTMFPGDANVGPPRPPPAPTAGPEGLLADQLAVAPERPDFVAGPTGVMDLGLDFAPDPEMAYASIVRGGGRPGTVADSPALAEADLGAELRGRPLDQLDDLTLAPEGVLGPFIRPGPSLGEGLGTDFGLPPQNPLLRGPEPPLEGEWIPGEGPPPRAPASPYAGAEDATLTNLLFGPEGPTALEGPSQNALPPPQRRLPAPPADDLGPALVESETPPRGPEPMSEEDAFWTEFSRDPEAAQGPETPAVRDFDETPAPAARARPTGGEMKVNENLAPDAIDDIIVQKGNVVLSEGSLPKPDRHIMLEPDGDRFAIRHTEVADELRGMGLGQDNYLQAARYAASKGKRLDSDVSLTKAAWRALKRALEKGIVTADDVPYAAIEEAFQRDPGVARNPSGKSWVTGIKPGAAE